MNIKFEKTIGAKLKGLIPRYGGYFKKELRRETDRLIREKALLFLNHSKEAVDQLTSVLAQKNQTELLVNSENLRSIINLVTNIVRTGEYGNSSIIVLGNINKKTLEYLAEYDAKVIIKAKQFQKHTEELTDKAVSIDINLKDIMDLQREAKVLQKDFERRKDIISGMEDVEGNIDYP